VPADKDAAKRRRQARNRQERQNRQARTEGAKRSAARPSRTVEETPDRSAKGAKTAAKGGKTDLSKTPARPQPAPGGLMGKLFPPRPQAEGTDGTARPARPLRPPSQIVEVEDVPGLRGLLMRLLAQPGGRATIAGALFAVVAAATVLALPTWPSPDLTGYGEMVVEQALDARGATEDEIDDAVSEVQTSSLEQLRGIGYPAPQVYFVVLISLMPALIGYMAVRALLRPTRSRALLWCSFGGVAVFLFNQVTGIYFLPAVICWGFAAVQSSRADKAALAAAS
jgi:hypothetical protein